MMRISDYIISSGHIMPMVNAGLRQLTFEEFFNLIFPSHFLTKEKIELRFKDENGRMEPKFLDRESFYNYDFYEQDRNRDVYFGVVTRFGKGGKKENCYRTQVVWCDFDNMTITGATLLYPQPSIVVDSGRGVHAYWLLDNPLFIDDELYRIESINRWLANKFNGDKACTDIARILRVPGTTNYKYEHKPTVTAFQVYPGNRRNMPLCSCKSGKQITFFKNVYPGNKPIYGMCIDCYNKGRKYKVTIIPYKNGIAPQD